MTYRIVTDAENITHGPVRMTHHIDADTELHAREQAYEAHRLAVAYMCVACIDFVTVEAVA